MKTWKQNSCKKSFTFFKAGAIKYYFCESADNFLDHQHYYNQKEDEKLAKLPEIAIKAWDERKGPIVFTTVDKDGKPNTIYASCVHRIGDDRIVVANNKMHKTLENIKAGTKASILYITKEKKAFQIKGTLDYHIDGDIYEDMKNRWLDKKYPGHGAVVLNIEEVYSGAEQLA